MENRERGSETDALKNHSGWQECQGFGVCITVACVLRTAASSLLRLQRLWAKARHLRST